MELANSYRGNDGGAYFVRRLQNKVYMFGEHPGRKYAVVFEGTLTGTRLAGQYWDVPKGNRAYKGTLALRVEQRGERLVVDDVSGGMDLTSLTSIVISNDQLPAAIRRPGFYATEKSDLDGAWRNGNSSLYVREVDSRIIGWEEDHFDSGDRPTSTRIILGERNSSASNRVDTLCVGIPKGTSLLHATPTFIVDDAWHLRQLGGAKWYRDIVDLQRFADEIDQRFKGKCVGYGYAIAHEGKIVKAGAGGSRLLAVDGGPLPFTPDSQKCTQSTAKTMTAVAVMHVLHARGMSVDDRIAPWLPRYWSKGAGVESLTFKHLLSHRSGLSDHGDPDEFENLRQTIAEGPVNMNWISPQYEYRNANYAMFRLIIPYLDRPSDMQNFEDNGLRGESLNKKCSERYLAYVQNHVFKPAGMPNRHADYSSNDRAYSYNFLHQNIAGYPQQPNMMYEMGAGGWIVSARDYTQFLAGLESGKVIPNESLAQMKSGLLGLTWIDSVIGPAYGHGGSIGGGSDGSYGSGRGGRAQSLIMPNHVQAYITINSANNEDPAETSNVRFTALRDAFTAAMHDRP